MRLRPRARFSAVLAPSGIHLVQYRDGRRGLQVLRYSSDLARHPDAAAAARALADLVEADGGRGGRLALAVAGFGSYHHILTLPPAPREVLAPIVQREMRRFYPDLFHGDRGEPAVEFIPVDGSARPAEGQPREILVAGVPRELLETVHRQLAEREIELEHWTILPRAFQRLYDVFVGGRDSSALLLMLPSTPLLGLFHEGALRLFSEPFGPQGRAEDDLEAVLAKAERGALFVRQQFRGASVDRFIVAAEPAEAPRLASELERRLRARVEAFEPWGDSPGAVVALGAALDVGSEGSLDLLPASLGPRTPVERWTRALAVASAAVLVAGAGWWAWSGVRAAERAEASVAAVDARLAAYDEALAAVRPVVEARREHAGRALLLESLVGSHDALPGALWPLDAGPSGVRIRSFELRRVESGWEGTATGLAVGATSAEVAGSVDSLHAALARALPGGSTELTRLAYVDAPADGGGLAEPNSPIAISFEISFIVSAVEEARP